MLRALFAPLAASLALLVPLTAGASGDRASAASVTTGTGAKIVLSGRKSSQGPWRRYLWLKLVRSDVTSFSVCAIWNRTSPPPPTCHAERGAQLPRGTIMRLGQRRAGPGWRVVGTSRGATLEAVLSNTVSGNRPGAVSYRVTLRDRSGRLLATSNTFKVFWSQ